MRPASPAASPRARRHRVIAAEPEEAKCGARRWKSAQDVHRPATSSKMPGDGALTLLDELSPPTAILASTCVIFIR